MLFSFRKIFTYLAVITKLADIYVRYNPILNNHNQLDQCGLSFGRVITAIKIL